MSTSHAHVAVAPRASSIDAATLADWSRIVVATVARGLVATLLGMAFWAAAPALLGWQPTTVMTGSMMPRVAVGDIVLARPAAPSQLGVGQVLLFDDPDRAGDLRLHRVESIEPGGTLVTKGDANPAVDSSPVSSADVHGVGVLRVPLLGLPIVWLHEGDVPRVVLAGLAFAVVLALTLIDGPLRRRPEPASGAATGPEEARVGSGRSRHRHRRVAARRHRVVRGVAGLSVIVVAASGIGFLLPPAAVAAPFAARTSNPTSNLTAATAEAATTLTCADASGTVSPVISWTYSGVPADSFDLMYGTTVLASAPGTATSLTYDRMSLLNLSLGTPYAVTLRTNLGVAPNAWSKVSTASTNLRVTSLLLGTVRCYP